MCGAEHSLLPDTPSSLTPGYHSVLVLLLPQCMLLLSFLCWHFLIVLTFKCTSTVEVKGLRLFCPQSHPRWPHPVSWLDTHMMTKPHTWISSTNLSHDLQTNITDSGPDSSLGFYRASQSLMPPARKIPAPPSCSLILPVHLQILPALTSKYIPNPTTSHHVRCCYLPITLQAPTPLTLTVWIDSNQCMIPPVPPYRMVSMPQEDWSF